MPERKTTNIDFFSDPNWPKQVQQETIKLENLNEDSNSKYISEESNLRYCVEDVYKTCFSESLQERKRFMSAQLVKKEQENDSYFYISNDLSQVNIKQQSIPEFKYEQEHIPSNQAKEQMSFSNSEDSSENFSQRKRNSKYKILSKTSKLFLVNQTQYMSVSSVAKMYGVSINNLCRWKKTCERKTGAGRKVNDKKLEEKLIDFIKIQKNRNGGAALTRRIIQDRAKKQSSNPSFKASKGWFQRFVARNKELELANLIGMKLKNEKTKREEMMQLPEQLFIYSTKRRRASERLRAKQLECKKQEEISDQSKE